MGASEERVRLAKQHLDAELRIRWDARPSRASDASLRTALVLVTEAETAVRRGRPDVADGLLAQLRRIAVDEWALGAALTEAIARTVD